MSSLVSQLESVASSPPSEPAERQALYKAAKKLFDAVEDPFDTLFRVTGSPKILTFSKVAGDLNIFKSLADSDAPLSGAALAESTKADHVLISRILRYLASNGLVNEVGEDKFAANNITRTLARPAFRAGISHSALAILPCLVATPKFLADTNYANPADALHSPFQIAHNTEQPAWAWAVSQPELMADFNLYMSELHDTQTNFLDVFDFAGQVSGSSPDTLIFVDVGGGIGQQTALLKKVHPQVPGRIVLQDQPFVIPHAIPVEGVEREAYDFWTEQPLKGARIYYLRNILHDYPDEKAVAIIRNHLPALTSDSILLIDEIIIPNTNVHQRATELDTTMMTSLAAIERTERQWDEFLDNAGLKILKKSVYNPASGESVIVTVPK